MTDSPASLSTLLDDYAMNAMLAFMQLYAPAELPGKSEEMDRFCLDIALRSYNMAVAMLEARTSLHGAIATQGQTEAEGPQDD